jgi:hypothetical protein
MWYNLDYGLSISYIIGKNILFLAQKQPTSHDKIPLYVTLLHIPIIYMQYALWLLGLLCVYFVTGIMTTGRIEEVYNTFNNNYIYYYWKMDRLSTSIVHKHFSYSKIKDQSTYKTCSCTIKECGNNFVKNFVFLLFK